MAFKCSKHGYMQPGSSARGWLGPLTVYGSSFPFIHRHSLPLCPFPGSLALSSTA